VVVRRDFGLKKKTQLYITHCTTGKS
jgi:hypothetical protein